LAPMSTPDDDSGPKHNSRVHPNGVPVQEEKKPGEGAETLQRPPTPPLPVFLGLFVLTANAAAVNVICYAGTWSHFVSHVTGNTARFALRLSRNAEVSSHLLQVFAFTFGACLSGILIPRRQVEFGRSQYGLAMLLSSTMLFISWGIVESSQIGAMVLASMALGLQNGMGLTCCGAVVRTTHMTGVVTDIGVILGKMVRRRFCGSMPDAMELLQEFLTFKLLVMLYVAYASGSWTGAQLFDRFGDNAILVPAFISAVMGLMYVTYRVCVLKQAVVLKHDSAANGEVQDSAAVLSAIAGLEDDDDAGMARSSRGSVAAVSRDSVSKQNGL